jgi:triacylglycerol lipase
VKRLEGSPVRIGLVLAAILLAGGAAPASMQTIHPDPAAFAPPPGTVPVLLVPGWGESAVELAPLRRQLIEAGWAPENVIALSFEDSFGSNEAHAREVATAVEITLATSRGGRVDILAHSMGGLAVREYLRTKEASGDVRRVIFLGTPHRGTLAAILAWGDGGREMVPGSPFLERLNGEGRVPDGIEILAVRTPVDTRVIPASSAMLPGVHNVEVCCPTHQGLKDDGPAFEEVRRFLGHGPEGPPATERAGP